MAPASILFILFLTVVSLMSSLPTIAAAPEPPNTTVSTVRKTILLDDFENLGG